jgi:hypothetical protein
VASKAECLSTCAPQIADACGGFRRAKYNRCRLKLVRQCRRFGPETVCPAPPPPQITTTTTRPEASVPTTSSTTTVIMLPPTTSTLPAPQCGGNLLLFADDGTLTYLGCVTCSQFSADSIFNQFGTYGNPFGAYSACNQFSQHPPVIVDEGACIVGRFSVNPYVSGSVCGILGSSDLCDAVTALCVQ